MTGQAAVIEAASLPLVEMTVAALSTAGGPTALQVRVLLAVERHGPLNLHGLAAELEVSAPSASRLVDRLVAAGLLRRDVADHSRREVRLSVTAKGRRALDTLRRRRTTAIRAVLGRMSAAERAALVTGLTGFARGAQRPAGG